MDVEKYMKSGKPAVVTCREGPTLTEPTVVLQNLLCSNEHETRLVTEVDVTNRNWNRHACAVLDAGSAAPVVTALDVDQVTGPWKDDVSTCEGVHPTTCRENMMKLGHIIGSRNS